MVKVGDFVRLLKDSVYSTGMRGVVTDKGQISFDVMFLGTGDSVEYLFSYSELGSTIEIDNGALMSNPDPRGPSAGTHRQVPYGDPDLPKGQMNLPLNTGNGLGDMHGFDNIATPPPKPTKRCECGQSDEAYVKHSDYCPLYNKTTVEVNTDETWD